MECSGWSILGVSLEARGGASTCEALRVDSCVSCVYVGKMRFVEVDQPIRVLPSSQEIFACCPCHVVSSLTTTWASLACTRCVLFIYSLNQFEITLQRTQASPLELLLRARKSANDTCDTAAWQSEWNCCNNNCPWPMGYDPVIYFDKCLGHCGGLQI
jgi:hypothetical protein